MHRGHQMQVSRLHITWLPFLGAPEAYANRFTEVLDDSQNALDPLELRVADIGWPNGSFDGSQVSISTVTADDKGRYYFKGPAY